MTDPSKRVAPPLLGALGMQPAQFMRYDGAHGEGLDELTKMMTDIVKAHRDDRT